MISLPGLFFWLLALKTCAGFESTTSADSQTSPSLRCPGECKDEHSCSTTLNETDCDHGLVCCVDHFDDITTTEFADLDPETVDMESTTAGGETYTYATEADAEENGEEYTYVYSDNPEDVMVEHEMENVEEASESCPGTCQSYEAAASCTYVIATDNLCPSGFTCCVTESDMSKTNDQYVYEIDESTDLVERESGFEEASETCPGTCVHPSHAMFCEEVLLQFPCPLNAKCCVKRSMERALPDSVVQCTGQCLPPNMHGYCFPPSEIVLGQTTCPRDSVCCMSRQFSGSVNPPSVNRMQFPGFPQDSVADPSQFVMGHLAIDEAGTIYKVSTNGQIFQLPKLTPADHARNMYTKLASYPRLDGEVAIFSDATGGLYQQFSPRHLAPPKSSQQNHQSPLTRQPVSQFHSPAAENLKFKESPSISTATGGDGSEDVIIPDDHDEAPVTSSTPVVHDDNNSRPACPGSCLSYFLRFTCFRGYATYDGFTCPGRSVCCARLKDIEDHEAYLKSLSPYFNVPPTSRDSSFACGLKGRRDTPRVIGGRESLPGEWCWQVAIINVQNQYICGGALIDNTWVLTAAHCVVGPMRENQALFVRVGVTDLKSPEDNSRGKTIRVLSTFVHHNFDSMNLDNNIALLRLQKPVELNTGVCVICLPTSGKMPADNSKCTVTGYGFVSKDGDMSLKIMEARVSIINPMECMTNVTEALTNPFILPSSSFCAGGQGLQDACQGDAGGALACEVGGYHELVGLVSWGLGCGRNDVPSIYVKVPSFMGWINQIISSSSFLTSLN